MDYRYHYLLRSFVNCPLDQRISVLRSEALQPLFSIDGYAKLLKLEAEKHNEVPDLIRNLIVELIEKCEHLINLAKSLKFSPNENNEHLNEVISTFRNQSLIYIVETQNTVASLLSSISQTELLFPEIKIWLEIINRRFGQLESVIDALTNPKPNIPHFLTDWLNKFDTISKKAHDGDFDVLEDLYTSLQNPIPDIRVDVATLLRYLKTTRSIPYLATLLNDEDMSVHAAAAESLGTLRYQEAYAPLIECLLKYRDNRWAPAWALGELRNPQSVKALCKALMEEIEDPQMPVDISRTAQVLYRALEAIGNSEVETILQHARNKGFVKSGRP
jgi:hypothetical protein